MTAAVLEVGPATVRLSPRPAASVDPDMISAALAGIDDQTVLLDERPVAVADLWRRIIAASIEKPCESMTVVHPSWWPRPRVRRIVDAAGAAVTDVRALSRSAAIAAEGPATVVEIADEVIAICDPPEPPVLLTRPDDPCVAAHAIQTSFGRGVLIDAPPAVVGGREYAGQVLRALRQRGVVAELVDIGDVLAPTTPAEPPPVFTRRHWRGPTLAAASLVVTLCTVGVTAARNHAPVPVLDTVGIVEGRVTLRIPPRWVVTRITAGPGSRRIQANSPTDPTAALHVAQSYVPGETLDRTADILRQAVAEGPHGVFVEFNPADLRGGRPAVTYREVRAGRDIRWTVVLDGSMRISIGCQSTPGGTDIVAEVCEKAIESAREVVGTNRGP